VSTTFKFSTLKGLYNELNLNNLKLNPLTILSANEYIKIINNLKEQGFDIVRLSKDYGFEIIQVSRLAWKKFRRSGMTNLNTVTYGAGSLWKLSVHPLKGVLTPYPSNKYIVSDNMLLLTRTGRIDVSGLVFEGFCDLVKNSLNKDYIAFTEHLLRVTSDNKDLQLYMVALFNSLFGKLISNIAWYGALQPQLDSDTIEQLPIPLVSSDIRNKVVSLLKEAYKRELNAWRSYFGAMKIVAEAIGEVNVDIASVSTMSKAKYLNRLDGSALIAINLMETVIKTLNVNSVPIKEMFDIIPGNVPWSKEYISTSGIPYIGTDAIDESSAINSDKLDRMPSHLYKSSFKKAKFGDILIVKDGIGSLGKIGLPTQDMLVRNGILILSPKKTTPVSSFYVASILKSRIFRKIIEMLAYGTTGQLHLQTNTIKYLKIPILPEHKEIGILMKSFISDMYEAVRLKENATAILEEEIKLRGC